MKHSAWILGMVLVLATPALAAEQKLVDLRTAPVSPSVLTEGKKEDAAVLLLRAAKRENAAAAGLDALLARQKARDAALMEIIDPDGRAAHALAKALQEKYGSFLTGNTAPENVQTVALQMVQSIFLNRRDDLASIQNLYADNAWQQAIRARLEKGELPELNVALNADKRAELQNTALYIHTPGKPEGKIEPAVHLLLTAIAQQLGHAGIADATKAGTPVYALFHASIAKALPDDPAAKEWLNDWLTLREGRARAVVEEFRPDGALMQDAVAQSETKRRSRLQNPPPVSNTRP